jgi:hypothetical protein
MSSDARREMGLRGRAYVEVRHDWDLLADRLADVLDEVVASHEEDGIGRGKGPDLRAGRESGCGWQGSCSVRAPARGRKRRPVGAVIEIDEPLAGLLAGGGVPANTARRGICALNPLPRGV